MCVCVFVYDTITFYGAIVQLYNLKIRTSVGFFHEIAGHSETK